MQRVLLVSLSHVFRSAAFLLLPFSFIALVAWSTAGSASGSTTDPIRGALWIWLGAHHVPFQLSLPPTGVTGYLTYLPIGAVVLPFLVLRSSFTRALDRLKGDYHDLNIVRVNFSIIYALLVTILAFISRSNSVAAQWYLAPLFAFAIALISTMTVGNRVVPSRPLRMSARVLSILLGVSFILISVLIFANFSQVKNISTSLQPGIFGGVLLLFLNILYLPNAAIAAASYFSGTGLAVGAGTLISPYWYQLGQIPALPLLGILPVGREPLALLGILFFVGLGALLGYFTADFDIRAIAQSYLFTVVGLVLLGYLASGSLITAEMGAMGVSIWKFALSVALEMGIGLTLTIFVTNKLLNRGAA
jgi:Family of unknown function (DUF6350)